MEAEIPMMACGHSANAKNSKGEPCCVICYGITDGADRVTTEIDLTGRIARCSYYPGGGKQGRCQEPKPSSTKLAFFRHQPTAEFDNYYCGCWGWD